MSSKSHPGHPTSHDTTDTTKRDAVDPVCGMSVSRDGALSEPHAGQTYHFCSAHCRARFRESPEQYIDGAKPQIPDVDATEKDVAYSCPMDPEVRQNEPGPCPKCGMALEPEMPTLTSARTEYDV